MNMMRKNCNTMYSKLSAMLLSAASLLAVSWGCVREETFDGSDSVSAGEITFRANLDDGTFATRSGATLPVTPDAFGETVFYIYERGFNNKDIPEEENAMVRPYWVATAYQGQLNIMPGYPAWSGEYGALNWFLPGTEHRFWSWTWPLEDRDYSGVDLTTAPGDEVLIFIDSDFPSVAGNDDGKTQKTVRRTRADDEDPDAPSGEDGPEEKPGVTRETWHNGEALERLVGAKTDRPYIFNQDGRYVPFTYKHLVSKIILDKFWLVDNTGATQKDLLARITFYGMPKRAMFFPQPAPETKSGDPAYPAAPYVIIDHTDPYNKKAHGTDGLTAEDDIKNWTPDSGVETPFKYELTEYLSFYILNKGEDLDNNGNRRPDVEPYKGHDVFYICPEVDFSQLEYKVEFVEYDSATDTYKPHSRYGNRGGYFGNFSALQFVREVEKDGEIVEEVSEDRILHAGEVMVLNMTVYEKSGPGAGVWIRNWDSEKLKSATHHNHKGIYSDGEATAVRSAFRDGNTMSDAKNSVFDIYGEEESVLGENGETKTEKVIRLYSDITFSCYSSDPNYKAYDFYNFYIRPEDVILDGMGYTISFAEPSSYGHEEHKTFTIGNMRDVYITNGTVTVYIDPEGYICRMDEETGKYVRDEKMKPNKAIPFVKD